MGKPCGSDLCECAPSKSAIADDRGRRVEPEGVTLDAFPTEWAMCEPVASSPGID